MSTAIVLFTRDLRVHDNPALAGACREFERVVPLFVLDRELLARSPGRSAFLVDCLRALDEGLRERGGQLVVRAGDAVAEVARVAAVVDASTFFVARDATPRARRREAALAEAQPSLDVRVVDSHPVVGPDALAPPGSTHYRVFTPYYRAWAAARWRRPEPPPVAVVVPGAALTQTLAWEALPAGQTVAARERWPAGEPEGRLRATRWLAAGAPAYAGTRDLLAIDGTSRLSPYLRLGCVSALELALMAGPGEYARQLCWRDFYHQVLYANPWSEGRDLKPLAYAWDESPESFEAWAAGRTGYPLVDAGMRQLASEGWLHNRARMVVASFLTKHLNLDWRLGARHFDRLLLDGDPANNAGGWQWVAGTGVDTRPGRMFNPTLQAQRFDPDGAYVRRHVPELAHLPTGVVHEPWRLAGTLEQPEYPAPIVDHRDAFARYRARFSSGSGASSAGGPGAEPEMDA